MVLSNDQTDIIIVNKTNHFFLYIYYAKNRYTIAKKKKIEIDYIGIVDMPLFSNIRNIQVH